PRVLRVAILGTLINEDRHDGESVIGLEQYLFCEQKPRGAVDELGRIVDRCTKVAGRAGTILDAKQMIPAVPLQALVPHSECISIAGCNGLACRSRAASALAKSNHPASVPPGAFTS